MRCNLCDGTGMRQAPDGLQPCPECGGCGVAHCCDGLVACGEIEGDIRFERAKPAPPSTHTMRDRDEASGFQP